MHWNANLTQLILQGGKLGTEELNGLGRHFSLNGLGHPDCQAEREQLIECFLEPYSEGSKPIYTRFRGTVRWALSNLQEGKSSSVLIHAAYHTGVSDGKNGLPEVQGAWFEYELRRRVHFSLELLLTTLTDTLIERARPSTVDEIVQQWCQSEAAPEVIERRFAMSAVPWRAHLGEIQAALPGDVFLQSPLSEREARGLEPAPMAFYAACLLLACYQQSEQLRQNGGLRDRSLEDPTAAMLERAFHVVQQRREDSFQSVLKELLIQTVVEPHLQTTFRKMGQQQKCSLRFFPEGDRLHPTGTIMYPGFSGDRLGNVLNTLADLGVCRNTSASQYGLTEEGERLLAQLEESSWF